MKRLPSLFPAFSVAFGVIYVVCMHFNIAAFVYYPFLGEWRARVVEGDGGPPMFFYGWLFYSFIGAVIFALAAAMIPQKVVEKIWAGWVWLIPLGAIVASVYFMRIWFVDVTG